MLNAASAATEMVQHHIAHDAPSQTRSPAQSRIDVGRADVPLRHEMVDFPSTAATSGLSKSSSPCMRLSCGGCPGPGGFFNKSSTSFPEQKQSPGPCQSTTRTRSDAFASLKTSASVAYIAPVIAFFLTGRFSWTLRMVPVSSVRISSIIDSSVPLTPARQAAVGGPSLRYALRFLAAGAVPLACKRSTSAVLNPDCLSITSLCSPSSGARFASTFLTPCT